MAVLEQDLQTASFGNTTGSSGILFSVEAFQSACEAGDGEKMSQLLDRVADCGINGRDFFDALHHGFQRACFHNDVEAARPFLDMYVTVPLGDVSAAAAAASAWAARPENLSCVMRLGVLSKETQRSRQKQTDLLDLLDTACGEGNLDIVRLILGVTAPAHRVDVHAHDNCIFLAAVVGGHVEVLRELLALEGDRRIDVHHNNEEAFITACGEGQWEIVCELLSLREDRSVDVHAQADAAFIAACSGGHLRIVRKLLDLPGFSVAHCVSQKHAALRQCVYHDRPSELVELLGKYVEGGLAGQVIHDLCGAGVRRLAFQNNACRRALFGLACAPTVPPSSLLRHWIMLTLRYGWGSAGADSSTPTAGKSSASAAPISAVEQQELKALDQTCEDRSGGDSQLHPSLVQLLLAWLLRCACFPEVGQGGLRRMLLSAAGDDPGSPVGRVGGLMRHLVWSGALLDTGILSPLLGAYMVMGIPPGAWAFPRLVRFGRRRLVLCRARKIATRGKQGENLPGKRPILS